MKKFLFVLLFLVISVKAEMTQNFIILGITEIAIIPSIDYLVHTKTTAGILDFSFDFLETENYLIDKSFHFIAGKTLTEINDYFLNNKLLSSVLSVTTLTLLECRRYFSIKDECFNIAGILWYNVNSYLKLPIYIRAGLRENDKTLKTMFNAYSTVLDMAEMYTETETEVVCKYKEFYLGGLLTVSKDKENKYGIRFGIYKKENFLNSNFVLNNIKFTIYI